MFNSKEVKTIGCINLPATNTSTQTETYIMVNIIHRCKRAMEPAQWRHPSVELAHYFNYNTTRLQEHLFITQNQQIIKPQHETSASTKKLWSRNSPYASIQRRALQQSYRHPNTPEYHKQTLSPHCYPVE